MAEAPARPARLNGIKTAAGPGLTALLRLGNRFSALLAALIILVVWELGCRLLAVPVFLLPPPSAIVAAGVQVPIEQWLSHVWATLRVTMMGYLVSITISLPLATALAMSPFFSRTFYPLLVIVQSMPVVAVAPIIVVTLGASDLPRVVITCLITFFPLVVTTATGILSTPDELVELSRSLRAGRWREITQIRLPYAVPYIFSALKVSITLAVIGAVVAEFVAADKGLGYFIVFSTSFFKVPQAFAALAVLVAMSLSLFHLIVLLQRKAFPWSLPKAKHG